MENLKIRDASMANNKVQVGASKVDGSRSLKEFFAFSLSFAIRCVAVIDVLSTYNLFILSLSYPRLSLMSAALSVLILSPYILAYSSDNNIDLIKTRLKNGNTKDNYNKENNLFINVKHLFFILPTTILFFIFLDVFGIIIVILRPIIMFMYRHNGDGTKLSFNQIQQTIVQTLFGMDFMVCYIYIYIYILLIPYGNTNLYQINEIIYIDMGRI